MTRHLSPAEIATAIGGDASYVRRLQGGYRPQRMNNRDLRDRIAHYVAQGQTAATSPPSVREDAVTYDIKRTPLGDAVLVAVGRFDAIQRMAATIQQIADESGRTLAAVATASSATVPVEEVLQSPKASGRPRQARGRGRRKPPPTRRAS